MSVPTRRGPYHDGANWERLTGLIRYALGSNARTFRLCLLLLAASIALSVIPALLQRLLAFLGLL